MVDQEFSQQDFGLSYTTPVNNASLISRIIAYIIDSIILLVFTMVIILILVFLGILTLGLLTDIDFQFGLWMFRGFEILILGPIIYGLELVYFTIFESDEGWGATPGKKLLNIKVVDEYGNQISLGNSFVRNLLRLLWFIPCIGLIILLIDIVLIADSDQRIGDKVAMTDVVND